MPQREGVEALARLFAELCGVVPNMETDGVGFAKPKKVPKKRGFSTTPTQNTTHSPAEVARAVHVMGVMSRLAAMPPEVIAALYALFNGRLPER
jgi:hypothetical protein